MEGAVIPVWLMLLCSIVMALGTSVGGEKIIKSVGMDMVKLEKYQGFSADLSAALCLLYSSLSGIPVSTTHTKTSAIMGVGRSQTPVFRQLRCGEGYGTYLDFHLPGLRINQLYYGKTVHCNLLI